ncbi:MAG: hypothetical protein GX580_10165, partial [Candidatus Hydrogenedens sp.]|nr:hypothetical protein [Candidatus Hydrogenedens sp.]
AVAVAVQVSQEHDAVLESLQSELDALRGQAEAASNSEAALAREVAALRENEAAKSAALDAARTEMDALRASLTAREQAAGEAEAANAEKQLELDRLQKELATLKRQANVAQNAESGLQDELEQLRLNEAAKNEALERSRAELEDLKGKLDEREMAAARAAREQEESRRIIADLENELAALRNKDLETASSQAVLSAEVSHVRDEVTRLLPPEEVLQAHQLTEMLEKLKQMQKSQVETQKQRRQKAGLLAAQQDSHPGNAKGGNAALEAAMSAQSSRRQSQLDALNVAMRQSSSKTPGTVDAAAVGQSSQRQTQLDAMNAAMRQSSRGQAAVTVPPAPTPPAPVHFDPDDADEDTHEEYPKPKDAVFVFPDQSVSMAAPRRKGRAKVLVAAVVLALLAILGVAAYVIVGSRPAAPADGGAAAQPAKPAEPEELTIEFPADRPFGTLYDHNTPHTSDTDWPPFATAQGLIEYPKNAQFHLVVRKDHMDDLSPLEKLPPGSIFSLWLPSLEVNEKNLAHLGGLKRVDVVYIDEELSPEDLKRVRGAFDRQIAVNCRQPDVVVRDISPPQERVFNFPESGIGYVDIRPWHQAEEPWQRLGAAAGAVTIPAKMEARLEIAPGITNLDALGALDLTALHTLKCVGPDITDTSMDGVAKLRGLLVLELGRTMVSDAGLAKLNRNTALEEIRLIETRVTDAGLDVFKEMPQLARIFVDGAPGITARGFVTFRQLRPLRRLHLANTGASMEDIRLLARDLTSCAVTPI